MIERKTDADNDWAFGKGHSDYGRENIAIEQNVKTRVLSWNGDCFFALPEGVDWRNRLDVGQRAALLEELRSVILQSYGVVGINKLDVRFDSTTRRIEIEYDIETIYSPSFQRLIQQAAGVENA